VSQMANRSKAVRFVAYGADIKDMLDLQGAHPNKRSFRTPDYFIRGGVTQHNKKIWSGQSGGGFSGEFEILRDSYEPLSSYSGQKGFGSISIDLNVGTISNLQMVPGMTSSNTIALYPSENESVTADLSVGHFGLTFSLNENIKRDFNAVYRTLIQVGMIELIGRLQKVPYWRCLENAGTIPERSKKLRAEFDQMAKAPTSLVRFVQERLIALAYYHGEANGMFDEVTRQAIESYQQHHNLLATGEIDFDMFKLMNLYDPVGGIRQVGLIPFSKSAWGPEVPYAPGLSVHAPDG
ncbi:MAG: peptidoglycan-binding protein, partial [Magnetococcales bacterium]|nr:peptidoglycan-binding protein [Magnetococcales bacterium]